MLVTIKDLCSIGCFFSNISHEILRLSLDLLSFIQIQRNNLGRSIICKILATSVNHRAPSLLEPVLVPQLPMICHKGPNVEERNKSAFVKEPPIEILFTVRKRSCGKVMFSETCVKNSVHSGGVSVRHPPGDRLGRHLAWADTPRADTSLDTLGRHPTPRGRHPLGRHPLCQVDTPPPADSYCSGWYASYWNVFL